VDRQKDRRTCCVGGYGQKDVHRYRGMHRRICGANSCKQAVSRVGLYLESHMLDNEYPGSDLGKRN